MCTYYRPVFYARVEVSSLQDFPHLRDRPFLGEIDRRTRHRARHEVRREI